MKIFSSLEGAASAFAGQALDAWAISRSAKHWGILRRPAPKATGFLGKTEKYLGDTLTSLFSKGPEFVLKASHVETLDISKSATISSAPQEDGAFLSYDKVMAPYQITLRMVCDGSDTGNVGENMLPGFVRSLLKDGPGKIKKDLIETLDEVVHDTGLYYVSTPEKIYSRANIISYRINRAPNGTSDMLVVDITLQEVRNTSSTGWVNTKYPQGAQKKNNGTVQPQAMAGEST